MPTIILDAKENIVIDPNDYFNEIRTLQTLRTGLVTLASDIKGRETTFQQRTAGKFKVQIFGLDIDGTKGNLDLIACFFHWFGVSVCNYARLVGFIRGLATNDFSRSDLNDSSRFEDIKKSVNAYAKGVSELTDVLKWRDKVAAHFAITDPRKADNISTLDMSVMFPVTFDGRYRVNGLTLTRTNSTGSYTSAIPHWSLTEVFENLIPRYWPDISVGAPPAPNPEN
jgi:hypothetical protein